MPAVTPKVAAAALASPTAGGPPGSGPSAAGSEGSAPPIPAATRSAKRGTSTQTMTERSRGIAITIDEHLFGDKPPASGSGGRVGIDRAQVVRRDCNVGSIRSAARENSRS